MPDIDLLKKQALKNLGSSNSSIADSQAGRNLNTQQSNNYNIPEVTEYQDKYAQEIKKAKEQKDADLKASGISEEDINKQSMSSQYWNNLMNVAKGAVSSMFDMFNKPEDRVLSPTQAKSTDQIKDEVVTAFNQNKSFERALKNGIVRNDDSKINETLTDNLPLLDQDDFLDNIKYGLGIEQDKLGNKKLSMSFGGPMAEYFFYLDKDGNGNDILAKTKIKDHDTIKKTGKTVLNAYGTTPFDRGFMREVGAGLSNTYAGLAKNLVNFNRGITNLASPVLPDSYVNDVTEYGKNFNRNYEIQQSTPGVGGTAEYLGSGIGQGASSLAQMAIMGGTGRLLGGLIAPAASATGKFENLVNFGAGSVLNYNEAYESALNSGLSEDRAASVGLLTGAINGLIESAVGTNRLVNWLGGGGDRALAREVIRDLGSEVTETGINRVFNNFKKGLSGDAGSFMNRIFENKFTGSAAEEGLEEFFQTFSQKGVENIYDLAFAKDKKVGEGKFGSEVFSKETLKEALESAMFGAILGAGGDISKVALDKISGRPAATDSEIIPLIAEGKRNEVEAIVKTLHNSKAITDQQAEFYLNRIDNLDKVFQANTNLVESIDNATDNKSENINKANNIKAQALGLLNTAMGLSKTNEDLNKRLNEINSNPDLASTEKETQIRDLQKDIQNNQLNVNFINSYVTDNFTTNENGEVPAFINNYSNNEDIVNNKFQRFVTNNDIRTTNQAINANQVKIDELENQLLNPESITDQSPKEVREELDNRKITQANNEAKLATQEKQLSDLIASYNEITSPEYQEKLKNQLNNQEANIQTDPVVATTTPIEAAEEAQVENNSNTQEDIVNAPVNQKEALNQELQQINETLATSEELDDVAINSLTDRANEITNELNELGNQTSTYQQDYDTYLVDTSSKADAVAKLEPKISEPALSAIKKDIEQVIAGFNSNGIDTSSLKELHNTIAQQLLDIRQSVVDTQNEANRIAEEEKSAKSRDNQKLVSSISFFDRLQRLTFMNTNPEFYTDQEVTEIFANTPVEEVLANISIVGIDPVSLGYTVGQTVGVFNSLNKIVIPSLIVSIEYNGKKLGNINQIDGISNDAINTINDFNITEEEYNRTIARNTKLNSLLKERGRLNPQDLQAIGFNLNWNGEFTFNESTPRVLVKDFKAAQLAENNGKPYIYDRVNQLEITEGTEDMRDNPLVPAIPEDLEERYVVLVKANNGKFYWVGAQNQVLDDQTQNKLYTYLFSQVAKLKLFTDADKVKEEVGKINRYLSDNIFVSIPYASLQLTTPNKTNKNYTLQLKIKGQKGKRVILDQSKFATVAELFNELGLNKTNLRTTLANNAPARETINKLSINTVDNVIVNPILYKQVTFKVDEGKLNDFLVSAPVIDITNINTDITEESDNPFADYDVNEDIEVADEVIPESQIDNSLTEDEFWDANVRVGNKLIFDAGHFGKAPYEILEVYKNKSAIQYKVNNDTYQIKYFKDQYDLDSFLEDNGYKNNNKESLEDISEVDNSIINSIDPSFENLSQDIKDNINLDIRLSSLLDDYNDLNKIKKIGVDVKVREIINRYRPSNGDPVFSIGTSEEIMDYPQAVEWINNNLPSTISVADVNTMLGNIKNNGTTFGAFSNNVIYLANNAEVGTQYHEAFHAVFRMLINDKQINVAYNLASKKYGKPSASDINTLKNSSSVYSNYTDSQLANLWLEEKMANDFKDYANSTNTNTSGLNSIWNKIKNFIRFISGNMDQLESLFYNINRGKFKNASIQSNVFSSYANQDRVFSIFNKGIDEAGNTITTTQLEGQGIIASLTNKLLQAKINKLYPGLTDSQILDQFIADKAKFYSIDENPYYTEYLEVNGKMDDDNFIDSMARNLEQKRNIFVLPANIAALKKDVSHKIQIFDIDESKAVEDAQSQIDDIGEAFDRDVWTIGGETSFSKVLREYISLVTIKTNDEYGQDVEEAVDFKKIYRGLVRALAGIEEEYVLPRFKALAEFDSDINAVFNQFISDIGLTNEGELTTQNITKNYDLYRKFVTAFNNENVGWYTVLHSKDQSRLIESNTAAAKDIQFNEWLQNYSLTSEELEFKPDLKKKVNSNLDFINRSENIVVNTFAEAKQRSQDIKRAFNVISIKLSNAYITYSLLKKSPYDSLDQDAKDYLNSFIGVDGLYDGGNIPFIVSEFKSGANPFISSKDAKGKERGASTRIKTIAEQNALFDPTVGESSFQNADGKTVYSIIKPSFGLVKLRWLVDPTKRQELLSNDKTKKDDFINPLETPLNHLLADENVDLIMNGLTPSMIDGYRQTNIAGDITKTEEGEGVTFGKFNAQQYLLADMLMFLSNRKSLNLVDENGKINKVGETAMFNINQMEASSTGYGVFLPVNSFKTINDKVIDTLFNYLAQEAIRINKVKSEFGKEGITTWVGYNDKQGARGFKLMEFSGYGLDQLVDEISDGTKTPQEVYDALNTNKQTIAEAIKNKLTSELAEYKETLISNKVMEQLPKLELIKQGYLKDKETITQAVLDKVLTDQYLNAYINTLGINNLLLDNYARKVKGTVDWYKRAKGIIGSGSDLGAGVTKVAVYKDPVRFIDTKTLTDVDKNQLLDIKKKELDADENLSDEDKSKELKSFESDINKGKIDIADAQSYITLEHKILELQRWGRFPQAVSDIYDKIRLGLPITWDEKGVLESNNAALNSTKTVAYNGDYYFKLSELTLSPNLVAKKDSKGNVIWKDGKLAEPADGMDYLFNKYNAMIAQGVDQALPVTASKMATIAPAEFKEDGKFDFSKSIMDMENKFKRLQVETPSGKTKITQGTQLIQLIASEQDDSLPVEFKYNTSVKTLGDLRDTYRQLLADNRLEGFKTAIAYMRDPLSGEFNSKELTKKFYDTIIASGSDEVLSNFFTPDHNGERQFNWNLGPIVNKAEQLFLAHFGSGVLSQKVPGLKVSLVSDAGIKIRDKQTGKLRELAYMQLDEDGNYYSECLLPPFANELLGKDPSDSRIQEVLKMFGVRIPTDDKHSMMSLKVVGFLPVEYGSIGVFPKQIVYLSGADFDIDSEFIHRFDFYTGKDGIPVPYGTAATDDGKFEEYKKWNLKNNKLLKSRFKSLGLSFAKATSDDIATVFKVLGLPSTLEEFITEKPINIGVNNNAMLEAQIKFLTNKYVREGSATAPVSTDSIEEAEGIVSEALGRTNQSPLSPNTPLARYRANRSNMQGKDGIGPVALSNVTQAFLTTNDVRLNGGVSLPVIADKESSGFTSIYTIGSDSVRKFDNMSALLNAMTDNAKLQFADKLNLTFAQLPTDTLPVAAYMLSIGYDMEETMLFLNQPSIRAYVSGDVKITNKLEELRKKLTKQTDNLSGKQYNQYKLEHTKALTKEVLINSLNEENITDVNDLFHIDDAMSTFLDLQMQASYVSGVASLMSLNKGLKSTFDDNLRLDTVLKNLQLDFILPYINNDVESYDDLMLSLKEFNIVDTYHGKYRFTEKGPTFRMNKNPNKTPFDARLAILNDPNTMQNIIIHKKVMDTSKEFFLLNTKLFSSMKNLTTFGSKGLIPHFMDKAYRTFLEEVYPDKLESFNNAYNNAGYMINKSNNSIADDLKKLKKDINFRDNILIKLLTLKDPLKNSSISQIEFPTRIKAEGDFYTNLNNAFKELFMNPSTTEFARKLYYYSYFKDGLQFRNKSFINVIPSWVFKDVSTSLDLLNDDLRLDDRTYSDVSSLKKGVIPTIIDMLNSFTKIDKLARNLNRLKSNDRNIISGKPNSDGTYTVTFSDKNGFDFSDEEAYMDSLDHKSENIIDKNAESYKVLLIDDNPGIKYDLAAHNITFGEDPTNPIETVSAVSLVSLKGYDTNGESVTMDLNEVLDFFLKNDKLPIAYEVTLRKNNTIKEDGLNSTINDTQFIDNMSAIKQSIPKEAKVETIQGEYIMDDNIPDDDTIELTDEDFVENLDNTENSSTFVNPFESFNIDESSAPELTEDDYTDMLNYENDINNSMLDEESLNDLDSQVDKYTDDDDNPIC